MISPRHKKNDMKVEAVSLCSGGTHLEREEEEEEEEGEREEWRR